MVDAVAEDVVHLDGVRGGAVDERGDARAVRFGGESLAKQSGGRQHGARQQRGVPVDHRAARVMDDLLGNLLITELQGPLGETFDYVH